MQWRVQLANLKFEKLKFQYEMYRDKQKDLAEYNKEMNEANFETTIRSERA